MKIDYNKFTEDELKVIHNAARTINYGFGLQFPSYKEQLALLIEDLHFRAINQIIQQTHDALQAIVYKSGKNPDK